MNILCVLTKQSARKIRSIYNFLKKQGFLLPAVYSLPGSTGRGKRRKTLVSYTGRFWKRPEGAVRSVVQGYDGRTEGSVREFDNWLAMLGGNPPEACAQMGRCSMQNIIEANGDVFPCDFYVLDQYRTGNVRDEDFRFFREDLSTIRFLAEGKERGRACPSCQWYPLCRGGCRRDYTPEGENYFCRAYQDFFNMPLKGWRNWRPLPLAFKVEKEFGKICKRVLEILDG